MFTTMPLQDVDPGASRRTCWSSKVRFAVGHKTSGSWIDQESIKIRLNRPIYPLDRWSNPIQFTFFPCMGKNLHKLHSHRVELTLHRHTRFPLLQHNNCTKIPHVSSFLIIVHNKATTTLSIFRMQLLIILLEHDNQCT